MTSPDHEKNTKVWVILAVLISVIIGIIVGCIFLFRSTETRKTSNKENYSISALTCESTDSEKAFFNITKTIDANHTIKISFKNDKPDKISYSYIANFETNELAKSAESNLHAKYNLYMGEHSLDPEKFAPIFVASDTTVRINLYADVSELNSAVGSLLFLTSDEQKNLETYSEKTVQNIYKNLGFRCDYNE